MNRQRVTDEHWELAKAWAEKRMPSNDLIINAAISSLPGSYRKEDGGVHVGFGGAEAFKEALSLKNDSFFWNLIRAGIPSDQLLPAEESSGFEGLYLGLCASCCSVTWMNDPLNGRHARAHCFVCLNQSERDKKRAQRSTDLSERTCQVCGDAFTPKRSHAKVCSPKCRAKLSRKKTKQRHNAPQSAGPAGQLPCRE